MSETLTAARRYVALGISVIPIPAPRPGVAPGSPGDGKVPAIAWREYQTRQPTDDELVTWFGGTEPPNVAIVTGAVSDLVAVDLDSPEARRWGTRRLPYTPWQTVTPRGYHLLYRHPGVRVGNRARIATPEGKLALDVRGDGGFVLAPPSVHASGQAYCPAGDWTVPRARVPRFWPGWLARPQAQAPEARQAARRPQAPVASFDVLDRARRYLAAVPRPEIGMGSDVATLTAACRLVRGFELSAADAESLLWEWAGGRPGWTSAWVAEKVDHAIRYGREPIGGLVSR